MKFLRRILAGALALGLLAAPPGYAARVRPEPSGPPRSAVGEAIYLHGVLGSGMPLVANRAGAEPVSGEVSACVNCHQRSGLGAKEARTLIPPVSGAFLFHEPGRSTAADLQLPYIPGARLERAAYTDATLARAIREGVDAEGHTLSYLMPRFTLGDADMTALITHLRSLERSRVPGVTSTELHFATIVTPDADPLKRRAVLEVLQHFFEDRNIAPRGAAAQTMETSGTTAYAKRMFRVNRRWVLHTWELTGPASTWTEQLQTKFAAEPVFAVISGIGGSNWAPVDAFCEQQAVPCLFPNLEQPPADGDRKFHSLYFSRGVLLEADMIAATLPSTATRVRQIYRVGDVGEGAARAFAKQLEARGVTVVSRAIPARAAVSAVVAALRDDADGLATVLWLRPIDLAALAGSPPPSGAVYLSGLMGGLDAITVPDQWRERSRIAYPFDVSDRRRVRVDFALGWFRIRKIEVVAEQVQADTYLACGLLSETLKHMVDAFIPDYLIESLQETVEHRILTGYYPRLTLGPHQRFASKGGYVMRFDPSGAKRLVPDGEWLTP
ncbi:MAG: cytochrome C [Pseudomonadota bacterium]